MRLESAYDGEYNIWWGRRGGHRRDGANGYRRPPPRVRSQYRCRPALDTGRTRGGDNGATLFCSFFARGLCSEGAACRFLHRLPTARDAAAAAREGSHDIFGRERLCDRDELGGDGGAGSWVSKRGSAL